MKRTAYFFLLLISISVSLPLFGQKVNQQDAARIATQFLTTPNGNKMIRRAPVSSPKLVLANQNMGDDVYVFNDEANGGFVIVSSDERMPAILGYSYKDTFKEDSIPCGMKMWLEDYAKQTIFLRASANESTALENSSLGNAIPPLISTTWGQEEPYNNMCPTRLGKHCVTGCGATVMAQVMYYYKWPNQTAMTIPQYITDEYNITMPAIEPTSMDWNSMKLDYKKGYSSQQADAVAKLMLLCGSAVKMDYGLSSSSSYDVNMVMALKKYFSYSSDANIYYRNDYSQTEWEKMIFDELSNKRPVIFAGQSSTGGHGFIVDGYEYRSGNNFFHVNWGWEGYEDDYFLFTDLNGYNSKQSAVLDLYPLTPETDKPYFTINGDVLTFYHDNKQDSRTGDSYNISDIGEIKNKERITKCIIDSSFSHYKPKSLRYLFYDLVNLKEIVGIDNINTDLLVDFSYFFANCKSLKSLDLSNWNTEHATNMRGMFYECDALESLDLSGFNTSNVTDMHSMFYRCYSLTSLDLSGFNTSNVTDMGWMFYYCKSLKNLNVSGFNTTNVTDMGYTFMYCEDLEFLDLSNFNTEKITDMSEMFYNCTSLKRLDISGFNTSNVTDMSRMFQSCDSLESLDLSGFNTANVTDMSCMFCSCFNLSSLDIRNFNTSNVTDMSYMLFCCTSLKSLDLSGFNTANVTDMNRMFYSCESLTNLDLNGFNTANVTNMSQMFYYCKSLENLDLSGFNTANVTDMNQMFSYCVGLKSLNLGNFNTKKVRDMAKMFYDCESLISLDLSSFNTDNLTDMSNMFQSCITLESLDISNFDTSNVTNMSSMFGSCWKLVGLDVSNFNTSNVTNMSSMFDGCMELTSLDVSNFNTSKVTNMSKMFNFCNNLTSLDVSNFNTSNVTDMSGMFSNCSHLLSLDVSNFNTTNVTDMSFMFSSCSRLLSLDVSNFNTMNVTDMRGMFSHCCSLTILDLSGFNTANVTDMSSMFDSCYALRTIYVTDWNTSKVTDGFLMFSECYELVGEQGTRYDSYDFLKHNYTYARIDGGPTAPGYFTKGINKISDVMTDYNKNVIIYNIGGQRRNAAKKGMYIIGNRKVVVK